jgi:hypothetical protein
VGSEEKRSQVGGDCAPNPLRWECLGPVAELGEHPVNRPGTLWMADP